MNNTKWNEIFKAFYKNECEGGVLVYWSTKDKVNGYIYPWDATWTHFGCEPREWERIEYLQIRLTPENTEMVLDNLKKIHVPGDIVDNIVTVYGYRTDVDYL